MSEYTTYLILAIAASLLLNIFLIWYAAKAGSKLMVVASNIDEIMSTLEEFENHLETIYQMETYYGDETIHSILLHARGIVDFLSSFESIYELSAEELPEETGEEEEWEKKNDRQKGEGTDSGAKKEKKKAPKKTVFYSGT
tara:strand:- start:533 stop:955 length:423 start_codon:yes stop_codon:yes gene_type:complete